MDFFIFSTKVCEKKLVNGGAMRNVRSRAMLPDSTVNACAQVP